MPENRTPFYAVARLALDELSDAELAAMNNCVQVDWDARKIPGYDKVSRLFAAGRALEGVKDAFAAEVLERIVPQLEEPRCLT